MQTFLHNILNSGCYANKNKYRPISFANDKDIPLNHDVP